MESIPPLKTFISFSCCQILLHLLSFHLILLSLFVLKSLCHSRILYPPLFHYFFSLVYFLLLLTMWIITQLRPAIQKIIDHRPTLFLLLLFANILLLFVSFLSFLLLSLDDVKNLRSDNNIFKTLQIHIEFNSLQLFVKKVNINIFEIWIIIHIFVPKFSV